MFSLILIGIGTAFHLYCTWRVGGMPWVQEHVGSWPWTLAALGVWTAYLGGMVVGDDAAGPFTTALAGFAFNWLAITFLTTLCLLAADLVAVGGWVLSRPLPWVRPLALGMAALLVGIALFQGLRPPVVRSYEVGIPDLPPELAGTRIVALSDLHLGARLDADWLARRVEQVQALEPDLVVLLGDLVEGDPAMVPGLGPVLGRLAAPLGVWAITGNHEFHGDTNATIRLLESAGIQWLRDRVVTLRPGLQLVGLDDRHGDAPGVLQRLLATRPAGGTTLLLSHRPDSPHLAAAAGVELMLAGHTHGGQIWPFGHLVQRRHPHLGGGYRIDGMTLLVCRGTGTWGPRMRLWRPGELMLITLQRGA